MIWCTLGAARELVALATSRRMLDDAVVVVMLVVSYAVYALVLYLLWTRPQSIARGLLPDGGEPPSRPISADTWFALGTALIGLWFAASAIMPILRNLSVLYVLQPELVNAESVRLLREGLVYYIAEFIVGLGLLFGATGIRRLIWRARNVWPD